MPDVLQRIPEDKAAIQPHQGLHIGVCQLSARPEPRVSDETEVNWQSRLMDPMHLAQQEQGCSRLQRMLKLTVSQMMPQMCEAFSLGRCHRTRQISQERNGWMKHFGRASR